jgi:pyruvate dehydrogenase E2 component (dihydrolipoamide acetyltransferase)
VTAIRVPRINQSATEAVLIQWLVEPGARVKAGDVLALIETDKSEIEVESPTDGTFQPHAKPGATYEVGALLAEIEDGVSRVRASPKARRLAKERGVDLATTTGSGDDGLVVAADLEAAPQSEWHGRAVRERRALDPVRARVASATTVAWQTTPHFVQMIDVDLTDLARRRAKWKDVTWTTLFVAALARALAQTPAMNAAVDGDDLVLFADVNIGVAVDSDRGLLVPVIASADKKPLRDLSESVKRATLEHAGDPVGASATVSNLGNYGIRAGTPVLHSPEPVLFFAGAVEERAKVIDGNITVRTMVTLSFAFDHRVTDGAPAARFVGTVRDILENPERNL